MSHPNKHTHTNLWHTIDIFLSFNNVSSMHGQWTYITLFDMTSLSKWIQKCITFQQGPSVGFQNLRPALIYLICNCKGTKPRRESVLTVKLYTYFGTGWKSIFSGHFGAPKLLLGRRYWICTASLTPLNNWAYAIASENAICF